MSSANPAVQQQSGPAGSPKTNKLKKTAKRKTLKWVLKNHWRVVLAVFTAAVVLLVGLPLGAVLIMSSTGCCFAEPESAVTFWAATIAGFLALFGMLVTGVFIITAFRVDATAHHQAHLAARDEVWKYIRNYRKKLAKDLENLEKLVLEGTTNGHEAIEAIADARAQTITAAEEARGTMRQTLEQMERERQDMEAAMIQARDKAMSAADETRAEINEVRENVRRQGDEATQAIAGTREAVEAAAQGMLERIDRLNRELDQAEDDPERPDE